MNKTAFKINTELLDIILSHKFKLSEADNEFKEFNNKVSCDIKDYTRKEIKIDNNLLNKKILEDTILSIADLYRDIPCIYFPVWIDQGGVD